jgi:glycosyltransferase involved in cell wall biosynthesis
MDIGINALYLIPGGVGGTEIYLRSLLAALAAIDSANRYFVFTNRETGPDLVPKAPNFTAVPQPLRAVNRPARIVWEQTALPLAIVRRRLDVLLNPGFTAPLLCSCPQVTVFHDLQHKRHPEYFRWFDLPAWQFFLFWSAHVSRLVLADSEATAQDLFRFYRLPSYAVRVVPLGVDPVFFDLGWRRRPEPFLLAVSTLHPHKNVDGLLRAFAAFRRDHPDFRLVVSGIHGFAARPLHD